MKSAKLIGIAFVAASILWGCNESQERPQPEKSLRDGQVQSSGQQETPSGEADEYGRMPGDEHYGHDHPPQDQQQTNAAQQGTPGQTQSAPQDGEPDQYGRMPGHAHYGHDHPPLDEEQKQGQTQQGSPVQQSSPVQQQQTAPADGKPDKYGRIPGDEHYGHDHP